ncbi:MAG: WYL domain-containing protein [Cyclobacteriaceae bacterium]|nr:MAG: WYL domain-containing protein [Cyclobacteriaceae bacterium]
MPVNRNALIRYRTIDNCLRNRQRRWTLEDLIEACSEALYEYEGIDKGVSRRSIQMDIQMMRSDKLGYNAPIIVLEKKYYTYEDPEYSITNIPLTDQDLGKLTEVVEILRQFKGFSHFQELSGMVQRLENKIYSARTKQEPIIDFEKNENLKGLEHIDTLYQAIINKTAVEFTYQSFKARSANDFTFHPYYLKEYRNRWFVLGVKKKDAPIMTLALDRIIEIRPSNSKYLQPNGFNLGLYFKDVIGVTVNENSPSEEVILFADNETAPYILTKPLHHSQKVVETSHHGILFSIRVQLNFELEREILGFGDRIKVVAPERLKRRIKEQFENALDHYQYELSNSSLQNILKKVEHKGFAILNHVFGKKEVNLIKGTIHNYLKENSYAEPHGIRNVFIKIPALSKVIFNTNLQMILSRISKSFFLTKAIYFDKSPEANWYVTWHQDTTINVKERIETEGFTCWTKKSIGYSVCPPEEVLQQTVTFRIHLDDTNEQNGALKVVPGSHNKKLSPSEIQLITQNSIPFVCDVGICGIHIMKPLLLHASSKATKQKHRRVIHLEFNTLELPNGLKWAEKIDFLQH